MGASIFYVATSAKFGSRREGKMSNTEILATVHRWMKQSMEREESVAVMGNRLVDCKEYIDRQWKLQEEHEEWRNEVFAKNDDDQVYFSTADFSRQECESIHRELEIGKDGTVTGLK